MELKTKQRWIGCLILFTILSLLLSLLLGNSYPTMQFSSQKAAQQVIVPIAIKPNLIKQKNELADKAYTKDASFSAKSVLPLKSSLVSIQKKSFTKIASPLLHKSQSHKSAVKMNMEFLNKKRLVDSEQHHLKQWLKAPKAWCVQLGSFKQVSHANGLIKQLRRKGFDAYIRTVIRTDKKSLLQVYVGPEIQKKSALQLRTKIALLFHVKGIVRKYKIQ